MAMGQTDQEPDPRKRVPTALWLMLGAILVALVVGAGLLKRPPRDALFGPPAGSPANR
jgi:hypothetical protein